MEKVIDMKKIEENQEKKNQDNQGNQEKKNQEI